MFVVIFEVQPRAEQFDAYLAIAKSLRPELEEVPGFIENIRYRSLTRPGWILSLSIWQDEKALIRWRTKARHHEAQEKGRHGVLLDYHLRVGQIIGGRGNKWDPVSLEEKERFDQTDIGAGPRVVLVDGLQLEDSSEREATTVAAALGLNLNARPRGLYEWDVFEAVLRPGDMILLSSWDEGDFAETFQSTVQSGGQLRFRESRTIRDYGKYDRREAPQYYEDVPGRETLHH